MQRREGSTLTFRVYHKTSPLEEKGPLSAVQGSDNFSSSGLNMENQLKTFFKGQIFSLVFI